MRLIALLLLIVSSAAASEADREAFFEAKVRPLLAEKCYSCHRNNPQGGLRLDSRKALLTGGHSGPAIVPGHSEQSLLVQAITHSHKRVRMPKDTDKLSAREIAAIRTWIDQDAAWPLTPSELFQEHVKPILEQRCLECHAGKNEGGLDLTSREGMLAGDRHRCLCDWQSAD